MAMFQVLVLLPIILVAECWDPDAGLVPSYTKLPGVSVHASSDQNLAHLVVDGKDSTNWVSSGCLPENYVSQKQLNILMDSCSQGHCTSSSGTSGINLATDGNFQTQFGVKTVNGKSRFEVDLPTPLEMKFLSIKGVFRADTQLEILYHSQHKLIKTLNPSDDYKKEKFDIGGSLISGFSLSSTADITISEVAALQKNCKDRVAVDFGQSKPVGTIRVRHWPGNGAAASNLLTSSDGVTWEVLQKLDPQSVHAVEYKMNPPKMLRFVAVEHELTYTDWAKSFIWEIDAWDENGRWGAVPKPQVNSRSLQFMFGVNGIWGWGHRVDSSGFKQGEGATLYDAICSHARNYHMLTWDIKGPGDRANYESMAQGHGTSALSWVNWDKEYGLWKKANLTVDATLQFRKDHFPVSSWKNPDQDSYNIGLDFARHFGSTVGNKLVNSVEVGNEPWDYTGPFYSQILGGMARGLKVGDPQMTVLAGAFQAHDKSSETPPMANYIGPRVTQSAAQYIDAVNGHYYNFIYQPSGVRTMSFPEDSRGEFNGVRNLIRWRDMNMPGKPVWITEWGWDSEGAGQTCTYSECVSEDAACLYGIRGLLILARWGIERATWFFYANLDQRECPNGNQHIFCRSGLTGSSEVNFAKKKVFYTFQNLLNLIGNKHFLKVVKEDHDGYIYLFGDLRDKSANKPVATHLVGWRPVGASDKAKKIVDVHLKSSPFKAWRIKTASSAGSIATDSLPTVHGDQQWQLPLNSEPLVVQIKDLHIVDPGLIG
ncbi:hypothetical protein SNE40_004447 [Patella caerulea]|uniref:F5/8 type C domain-containing protein n=2 Tax=Patella caerulea TaxID=87958 RepID=A0AAN8K2Z6_PATCE